MSVKRPLIEIGFDKNGEPDFGITCDIGDLSVEKMNQLRAMIIVAIGTAEDMFRRQKESENVACSNTTLLAVGINTSDGHANG